MSKEGWLDVAKTIVTDPTGFTTMKKAHKMTKDQYDAATTSSPSGPGQRAATPSNMSSKTAKDWVKKNKEGHGKLGYK